MLKTWPKYIIILIVAFGVRYALVKDTPRMDKWIDLVIYADGGQLIDNGVNPYNFLDNMKLRDSLRRDTVAYNYYVDETQERWNFYANSNLPLSLLYYGVVEKITGGSLFGYRMVFILMDSILAVLLSFFIFQYWKIERPLYSWMAAIGLGVISPILLDHGAIFAEDKGIQILLMIAAIHFSKRRSLFLGALCLGWSIAFKGLGVFIAPLCLYYFISEPVTWKGVVNKTVILRAALFTTATTIFAAQPFIFYLPQVIDMATGRLDQNLNMTAPIHSSVWRFVYLLFPLDWEKIKLWTFVLFVAVNLIGFFRRSFGPNVITVSLLLWFVDVSLLGGSLDRMNIGFLVGILILGMTHVRAALMLSAFYVFGGCIVFLSGYTSAQKVSVHDSEFFDAAFSLLYVVLYLMILMYYAIKGSDTKSINSTTENLVNQGQTRNI